MSIFIAQSFAQIQCKHSALVVTRVIQKKDKEGASWTYDTPSLDNEYQEEYYIKMI